MRDAALRLLNVANVSIMPVGLDKRPAVEWKSLMKKKADTESVIQWFKNPEALLGIICGKVSGGLEVIDVDLKYDLTGELLSQYQELIRNSDPDLLDKLLVQTTVNLGYHMIYRCSKIEGNQKLAQRETIPQERKTDHDKTRVLIETRGEGGYIVGCPTEGYEVVQGSFDNIPTLTPDERDLLLSAARACNLYEPKHQKKENHVGVSHSQVGDVTPFDDYDSKVSHHQVIDLLQHHGWRVDHQIGEEYYLTRPGKDKGISATYNHVPDRLFMFTSSTQFDPGKIYKPCAVYAILEHDGDYVAAAKELHSIGYGVFGEKQNLAKQIGVVRPADLEGVIHKIFKNGLYRGETTGYRDLDDYFRVCKGQMNIITGIPSHGKSEFADSLLVNLAMLYGWKFAIFSPENFPYELHVIKFIEKFVEKGFYGGKLMTEEEMKIGMEWVKKHFYFIDAGTEDVSIDAIYSTVTELVLNEGIDGMIIDPWNELESEKPAGVSMTDFVGNELKRNRKFARKHDLASFIVAHPTKIRKNQDGTVPVPTLYDIADSAHWYNKADNGFVVYRNAMDETELYIQKVKQRQFGKKGMCKMKFDTSCGKMVDAPADWDKKSLSDSTGGF